MGFTVSRITNYESRAGIKQFEYWIDHPDGRRGFARVWISSLEDEKSLHEYACKNAIPTTSLVGELSLFKPNGNEAFTERKYGRRGVGSAVLARILEDCKSEGCAALFCDATTVMMKKFCLKKGFESPQGDIALEDRTRYIMALESVREKNLRTFELTQS